MRSAKSPMERSWLSAGKVVLPSALVFMLWMAGCGGSVTSTSMVATSGPQTYFAPIVAGTTYSTSSASSAFIQNALTYTMDDTALTFAQTTYQPPSTQPGPQVLNAGDLTIGQRGLRSLGITANYVYQSSTTNTQAGYYPITHNPPEVGSFAVELANQAGGLVQLVGQPAVPLVAATACPNSASSQTYLFTSIPGGLTSVSGSRYGWDPATDTAYGVVQISASGSTVTLQNIQQFTLSSASGTGAPAQPSSSSATGTCASSVFGNTTVVPGQLVITNPNPGGSEQIPPQATIGIGPTGLLVEDNGSNASSPLADTSPALYYNNVLGAGTGAVGLPQSSSALSTSAVVSAQYLGFIYGAGVYVSGNPYTKDWSSHVASFGFSSLPSSCASVTASTSTLIYGGDYPNDNPSVSATGFSNCDFAIDLGVQSSSHNGLYPNATVWVGAGYAANASGTTYSFPAVAIAGQLNGKYALFVLGVDSTQPWAIYLLQSN